MKNKHLMPHLSRFLLPMFLSVLSATVTLGQLPVADLSKASILKRVNRAIVNSEKLYLESIREQEDKQPRYVRIVQKDGSVHAFLRPERPSGYEAAVRGDAYWQYKIGMAFLNDREDKFKVDFVDENGAEQKYIVYKRGFDSGRAIYWLLKSADQGNVMAQAQLGGICYGSFEENNNFRGPRMPEEMSRLGFDSGGDRRAKAIEWWQKAAEKEQPEIAFVCGLACEEYAYNPPYKSVVTADDAYKWYRKAADLGHPEAQNRLGLIYQFQFSRGDFERVPQSSVKKDDNKSAIQFQRAAEQGYSESQFFLYWIYHYGIGVNKDRQEASRWLAKAAVQGHEDAVLVLSAEAGDADAQYRLGKAYGSADSLNYILFGKGTASIIPKFCRSRINNDFESSRWLRLAADQGHTQALAEVGGLLGDRGDYKEAVRRHLQAAEQGSSGSQYRLYWYYHLGIGVNQDQAEALKWLGKASKAGHVSALITSKATQGDPESLYHLYTLFVLNEIEGLRDSGRNWKAMALDAISKSADQKFMPAIAVLAKAQAFGRIGLEPDLEKAFEITARLENAKDILAYDPFVLGRNAPDDNLEALRWIKAAANTHQLWNDSIIKRIGMGFAIPSDFNQITEKSESVKTLLAFQTQGLSLGALRESVLSAIKLAEEVFREERLETAWMRYDSGPKYLYGPTETGVPGLFRESREKDSRLVPTYRKVMVLSQEGNDAVERLKSVLRVIETADRIATRKQ